MRVATLVLLSALVVLAATQGRKAPFFAICPCRGILLSNRNKYEPVCASDGVTYQNRCELECDQRGFLMRAGRNVTFARNGTCEDSPAIPTDISESTNSTDTTVETTNNSTNISE